MRTLCGRYADFEVVTRDALRFSCDSLGLALTAESETRLMEQYTMLDAFPENAGVVSELKARGLPLAVLSNGTPYMIGSALAAAGMTSLLDHVLSADQVRKFKTAPEVYQLGPDAFGRPAGEILFVSSNGWDVCGATWFGYTTFWVNRAGQPRERLGVEPHGEGRSLADVLGVFSVG